MYYNQREFERGIDLDFMYSDNELIHLARNGSDFAEEMLAKRYSLLVRICARQFFLVGGEPEDLIQEGMLGLLSAIRKYDVNGEASFKTYAERCIRNRLVSTIEGANRLKNAPLNQGLSLEALNEAEEHFSRLPEDIILEKERLAELQTGKLSVLSEYESQVLRFYLDGLSYREIAERLSKSEKSIDNAVQRIRRKFAEII